MSASNHHDIHASIASLPDRIKLCTDGAILTRLNMERASLYEELGDSLRSVSDYLAALDTAEDKADIVHIKRMIALALARMPDKEQAIYWAMQAVDADPCDAEARFTLGLICEICELFHPAIESLQRALDLEPDHWAALRVLGVCQREIARPKESVETLSRYVANNPDEPTGLYELAWSLHLLARSTREFEPVKELYERALKYSQEPWERAMIERKLRDIATVCNPAADEPELGHGPDYGKT